MRRTRASAAAGAINLKQRCGQCKTCMNNYAGKGTGAGWAGGRAASWAGEGIALGRVGGRAARWAGQRWQRGADEVGGCKMAG